MVFGCGWRIDVKQKARQTEDEKESEINLRSDDIASKIKYNCLLVLRYLVSPLSPPKKCSIASRSCCEVKFHVELE